MCHGEVTLIYDGSGNAWNGQVVCFGSCDAGFDCVASQPEEMILNPFGPNERKVKVQRCVCVKVPADPEPKPGAEPPETRIPSECQAVLVWQEDESGKPTNYQVGCVGECPAGEGTSERPSSCHPHELIDRRTYFKEGEAGQ